MPVARPRAWELAALVVLGGCFTDRPRPNPLETVTEGIIVTEVLRPQGNATVIAGRPMLIDVEASAEGGVISGLGYLVRVVEGGQRLDSLLTRFPPRPLVRDSFQLVVPGQLPTNTHLSINALAFTTRGVLHYSRATQVVVAQCTPEIPACR